MKRNCANLVELRLLALLVCLSVSGVAYGQDITLQEEETIQQVVQRAAPHIVRIETVGGLASSRDTGGSGPTSGVVVSKDGFVVASAYPFAKLPSAILVTLPDGQRTPGKLVRWRVLQPR